MDLSQSRLKPGRMLLVDTEDKKIIQDVELKLHIAKSRPHSQWLREQVIIVTNTVPCLCALRSRQSRGYVLRTPPNYYTWNTYDNWLKNKIL